MSMDRFSTYTIMAMVEEMEPTRRFFTNLFFPGMVTFDTDTIEWDIKLGGAKVAPFVAPLAEAPVRRRESFASVAMKPAYVKLKDFVSPTDALTRLPGEGYGNQQLSPSERMQRLVGQQLVDHDQMLTNRIEWMAAKTILDGQYTVSGEGYQPKIVDFNRPASLEIALAGAAAWDQTTSSPVTDLEDAAIAIRTASKGAVADTVIMHTTAWQLIREHPQFKDRLRLEYRDQRINQTRLDDGIMVDPVALNYVGRLDGKLDIYVIEEYFQDDDGNDVAIMPDNTVVVASRRSFEGQQYYGAIMDEGFQSVRLFSKSRSAWDPYGEEVLSQSAPLVAPKRANTWAVINVA